MVELSQLWLPILLSGVAVFFLSYAMWMVSPHHQSDWKPLPDEDGFMDFLRKMGTAGSQSSFPHCSGPAQMKDPVWMEKYVKGPKGFLILKGDGPESIGKTMFLSFLFNVVTAAFVAHLATMALGPGEEGALVFHFVFGAAFLANSFALVWAALWFGRTWSSTLKEMFDGLLYAVATALVFMLLWPGA